MGVQEQPKNVFDWLDEIRHRPGMFLGATSTPVRDVETLIHGYYGALSMHGMIEPVPSMAGHFSSWLRLKTSWSMSCGWAVAITEHCEKESALSTFFDLVEEYRQLLPVTLATVKLHERNQPTGKRATIGFNGRIERPDRVDIVQYSPSPLHFLRFHYGKRIVDQYMLYTSNGSDATTPEHAEAWVRDELGVTGDEWQRLARTHDESGVVPMTKRGAGARDRSRAGRAVREKPSSRRR